MARAWAAGLAGAAAAAAVLVPASAPAAPSRDRPPECVTVRLVAPSGQVAWVVGCGGAAGAESPWADWLRQPGRQPVTMDGTRHLDPANCPKANPCVIIALNAPGS
jgi:hypothetical protein